MCPIHFLLCVLTGKNWDVSAALSDFEQLRQVHAGILPQSFSEGSGASRNPEKGFSDRECTRPPRPTLQRQDDIVQGNGVTEGYFIWSRKEAGGTAKWSQSSVILWRCFHSSPLSPAKLVRGGLNLSRCWSSLLPLCILNVILNKGFL